jgi:hypothetical protein
MTSTYEQDSALIDKILIINAGISGDQKVIKQAGIVDMLGGLASTIQNLVAQRVEKEGVAGALVTYLGTSALWRINPLLGVVAWAANAFGFSLGSIFKSAYDAAIGTIQQNGKFDESDAKRIAEDAVGQISTEASLDAIRDLEKQDMLTSVMQGHGLEKSAAPKMKGMRGAFGLFNIFKYFGKGKTSFTLIAGFVKWFIWAALMGLTLIEGPKLVANLFGAGYGGEKEVPSEETTVDSKGPEMTGIPTAFTSFFGSGREPATTPKKPKGISFPKIPHNLITSGKGQKYFLNTLQNQWWIKVPNGDIRNAMLNWAMVIYPELSGYENEIRRSKSFDRTAYSLARGYDQNKSKDWLKVPLSNLHTWKDIVDTFAGEAAKRVEITKSKEAKK